MKPNGRKQNMALPAALACGLLLFLVLGGVFFTQYLKEQIFVERSPPR